MPRETLTKIGQAEALVLLQEMLKASVRRLEPVYDMLAPSGYCYPFALEHLKAEVGGEVHYLESLSEHGAMHRRFFDRILLCPFCEHHDLNLRDTCIDCASADVHAVDMIHHYRCAYTAIEDEFKQGIRYVCPKCRKLLTQIGVDYDKPGKNYLCGECQRLSPLCVARGQCRACQKQFMAENARRNVIYAYDLTPLGLEAARLGAFPAEWVDAGGIDPVWDVYTRTALLGELQRELERCRLFHRSLTLISIRFTKLHALQNMLGYPAAEQRLTEAILQIKGFLRSVDIPGRFEDDEMVIAILETNKKGAEKLVEMIREKLISNPQGVGEVQIQIVSFPEDSEHEHELFKRLLARKES